jgi:hypothetical protein
MILDQVEQHLRRIEATLRSEDGQDWMPGIELALEVIASHKVGAITADKAMTRIREIYESMHKGPGSFGDFNIWREDSTARRDLNDSFKADADALWKILGCS